MPDPMPAHDPLTLLQLAADTYECPQQAQRPPFAYDLLLAVPGDPLTPLEQLWQPGDRIELQVREGIIDSPQGGSCAIWRGRTHRPGSAGAESEWTPTQTSAPDCLPVPEPPADVMTSTALIALAFVARWRRPR